MIHLDGDQKHRQKALDVKKQAHYYLPVLPRGKIISNRIFHCPVVALLESVPVSGGKNIFQSFPTIKEIKMKSSTPLYSLDTRI